MLGVVVKSTGSWYRVRLDDGTYHQCRIKGKFRIGGLKSTNPVSVGDRVKLSLEGNDYMINEILQRKNYIIRKSVNLSKQVHIIASNIDQAFLIVTLVSPFTSTGFIDRFLVSANAFGVNVVLLFNKTDIYNKKILDSLEKLISIYKKIGYECVKISALNDNLNDVKKILKGKNNLVSGHSGVGKSTFINKLLGTSIPTAEVSLTHDQGQHTTTFSQLYRLDSGGAIIDTPGIKGFGLVELDNEKIRDFFPEFVKLQAGCKFNNCKHINEPECNVLVSLNKGLIANHRYNNYLNILETEESIYRINNF